jgi:hypothetical protein
VVIKFCGGNRGGCSLRDGCGLFLVAAVLLVVMLGRGGGAAGERQAGGGRAVPQGGRAAQGQGRRTGAGATCRGRAQPGGRAGAAGAAAAAGGAQGQGWPVLGVEEEAHGVEGCNGGAQQGDAMQQGDALGDGGGGAGTRAGKREAKRCEVRVTRAGFIGTWRPEIWQPGGHEGSQGGCTAAVEQQPKRAKSLRD